MDYDGRLCGFSDGVKGRPNGYYLTSGAGIQFLFQLFYLSVVCVKHCPDETDYTQFVCLDNYQNKSNYNIIYGWEQVSKGVCMFKAKTDRGNHLVLKLGKLL